MSVVLGKRQSEKQDESMSETKLAFECHQDSKVDILLICFLNAIFYEKLKFSRLRPWCKTET